MKKLSAEEKVVEMLREHGCYEIQSRSKKYRTFAIRTDPVQFYFVGKKGALRKGRTASNSFSVRYRW